MTPEGSRVGVGGSKDAASIYGFFENQAKESRTPLGSGIPKQSVWVLFVRSTEIPPLKGQPGLGWTGRLRAYHLARSLSE